MSNSLKNDPRYSGLSELGRTELGVYLQWIQDAKLEDTEYSFVAYILGRCSINDFRHLYKIWESQIGDNADKSTKRMIRRFFANPSPAVSFNQSNASGWFEFISSVHQLKNEVTIPSITIPVFTKVGFDDLPNINSSIGFLSEPRDSYISTTNDTSTNLESDENLINQPQNATEVIKVYEKQLKGLGTHFYSFFLEGSSAEKKLLNFSKAYSKAHYKPYDHNNEAALLFYDGTILGSGKEGILFTEDSILAHGSLGDGAKSLSLRYDQISSTRLSNKSSEDKQITVISSGHAYPIVLKPIFIDREDVILLDEMINKIIATYK